MKATEQLHRMGQSLWLDNITRGLLTSGTLERYIRELSITGLTSNPSIFDHAIRDTGFYDEAIRGKMQAGARPAEKLFFESRAGRSDARQPTCSDPFTMPPMAWTAGCLWRYLRFWRTIPSKTLAGRQAAIRFGEPAESVHQDSRNSERTLGD